jgi:hypothetical protein
MQSFCFLNLAKVKLAFLSYDKPLLCGSQDLPDLFVHHLKEGAHSQIMLLP